MRFLIYVMCIIINGFLIFKLPIIFPKKKVLIVLGSGILLGILFLIIGYFIFLMYSSKVDSSLLVYEKLFLNICMGIISLFFFNLFLYVFLDLILDNILIKFHQIYNSESLTKNPIKFVIANSNKIKFWIKLLFFLGGFVIYYGVCFGDEKTVN